MNLNNTSNLCHNFSLATFIITYRCPISCPMCFFACGPDRQEVMSQDLALKTLDEINMLKINTIGIAGGEPFLQVDLMRELIKKAASYRMRIIAVTNAHWGISKDEAVIKLSEFRKLGLNWIQISLDDHHQRFIPFERVANVIKAAIELNFEDIKVMGSSQGNSEKMKYQLFWLKEVLGVCLDKIDLIDRPRVSHKYFEDSEQKIYSVQDLEKTEKNKIKEGLDLHIQQENECFTELMVDLNGDIYPCCNNFIGRIGNVSENNLQNILKNMCSNNYFDILKRDGPFKFTRYLDRTLNTDFSKRQYGSRCEVCARIFQTDRFRDLLTHEHPLLLGDIKKRR
jgi:MoaA/NifB/PqqE/SkfB family radical SAM enzyme